MHMYLNIRKILKCHLLGKKITFSFPNMFRVPLIWYHLAYLQRKTYWKKWQFLLLLQLGTWKIDKKKSLNCFSLSDPFFSSSRLSDENL